MPVPYKLLHRIKTLLHCKVWNHARISSYEVFRKGRHNSLSLGSVPCCEEMRSSGHPACPEDCCYKQMYRLGLQVNGFLFKYLAAHLRIEENNLAWQALTLILRIIDARYSLCNRPIQFFFGDLYGNAGEKRKSDEPMRIRNPKSGYSRIQRTSIILRMRVLLLRVSESKTIVLK